MMMEASSDPVDALITQARRMASLARPNPSEPIVVLGPDALTLTVELCRDGFQEVVCGCRFGLPRAREHSSTVFVSGPATPGELRTLLRDACAVVGREGRLVVRLASIDQDREVEALLAELGVQVRSAVYDLSREVLVCHQVERATGTAPSDVETVERRAA